MTEKPSLPKRCVEEGSKCTSTTQRGKPLMRQSSMRSITTSSTALESTGSSSTPVAVISIGQQAPQQRRLVKHSRTATKTPQNTTRRRRQRSDSLPTNLEVPLLDTTLVVHNRSNHHHNTSLASSYHERRSSTTTTGDSYGSDDTHEQQARRHRRKIRRERRRRRQLWELQQQQQHDDGRLELEPHKSLHESLHESPSCVSQSSIVELELFHKDGQTFSLQRVKQSPKLERRRRRSMTCGTMRSIRMT